MDIDWCVRYYDVRNKYIATWLYYTNGRNVASWMLTLFSKLARPSDPADLCIDIHHSQIDAFSIFKTP